MAVHLIFLCAPLLSTFCPLAVMSVPKRVHLSYSVYGPGVDDEAYGHGYYYPHRQQVLLFKDGTEGEPKPSFVRCAWVMDDTKGLDTDPRQFPHVRFNRLSIKLFKTEDFPGEEHVPHATLYGSGASNETDKQVYGRLLTLDTRAALGLAGVPGAPRKVLSLSQVKERLYKFLAEEDDQEAAAAHLAWCSQHSTPATARDGDSAY